MKRIVLCADDYGQAPAISQAIITLITHQRLSASSCMVNTPYWPEHAANIVPFRHQIDIGLHLNLTEGNALSKQFVDKYGKKLIPLPLLLLKAMMRGLDRKAIEAECQAQVERFMDIMGFAPAFIDGHQHVHQFPIIRESLLEVYRAQLINFKPYIRWVGAQGKSFKKRVIRSTGGRVFRELLERSQIPHNRSFAGIYSFSRAHQYAKLFPLFLNQSKDQGIIMCHPGLADRADKISQARMYEYAYLLDLAFPKICQQHNVLVTRFS